jgi:nucleoside-diphosphate-sugar epimerase
VYDLLDRTRRDPVQLSIIGDGTQTRDFVFVGDVARAALLLAKSAPGHGEVYNIASGRTVTIATLAEMICRTCGAEPEITYTGSIRDGDAQNWTVDIGRLTELGYRAECSLENGLRATLAWYDKATSS